MNSSVKDSLWLETVVCSARKGVDARLERMLEARQEMRRRTEGCVRAWVSRSMDGQPMFLLQAIYEDQESWHRSAKRMADELDSRDGGIETLLGGPPLVGIFSLDPENLDLGKSLRVSHNIHYATRFLVSVRWAMARSTLFRVKKFKLLQKHP